MPDTLAAHQAGSSLALEFVRGHLGTAQQYAIRPAAIQVELFDCGTLVE